MGLSLMEPVRNLQSLIERAWELHDSISDEIQFSCFGLGGLFLPLQYHHHAYARSREDPFAAERKSLIAIRDAMRLLHYVLLSLQKSQSRQRIEREAALMRLEDSRLFLWQQIAEYPGSAPNVIQEMLKILNYKEKAFDLNLEYRREKRCMSFAFFSSCLRVLSSPWRLQNAAGVLGKLVVVAASLFSAIHFYKTRNYYFQRKESCMPQSSFSHGMREHPFSKASAVGEFRLLQNFSNRPSDVFYGRG